MREEGLEGQEYQNRAARKQEYGTVSVMGLNRVARVRDLLEVVERKKYYLPRIGTYDNQRGEYRQRRQVMNLLQVQTAMRTLPLADTEPKGRKI